MNKPKKPKYRIVWRNANGKFAPAPKGRTPKGWKKYRLLTGTGVKTPTEKRMQKDKASLKKLGRAVKKGVKRVKLIDIPVSKERHLRFRKIGVEQWTKKPPRLRTKVQVAVFEGNKFASYWKSTAYRTWDRNTVKEAKQDAERIRFPQNQRVEFPLSGETWRDALDIISVQGLRYNSKLFYEMRFSGLVGNERVKFYHRSFISFKEMYGMSYDAYLNNQLTKVILDWCNSRNVVFTSREKIEEIAIERYEESGEDFWLEWMENKLENFTAITNVRGSFVGFVQ
jgi:hypothetical protein